MPGLFDLPSVAKSTKQLETISKHANPRNAPDIIYKKTSGKANNVMDRIRAIAGATSLAFGDELADYECVTDSTRLAQYVDRCIANGICAVDTETDGLNPLTVEIAGFSLYTPGEVAIYVPLTHLSYISYLLIEGQIPKEEATKQIQRVADAQTKLIMFNAVFDIRVIWSTLGVKLRCYFDCYVAARLLNENEPSNRLKDLYSKYCLEEGDKKAKTFDELFDGIVFRYVPIKHAYPYAAKDAKVTFKLYEYQEPYLTAGTPECAEYGLERVSKLFWDVEMPVLDVCVDMEQLGMRFSVENAKVLHNEFEQHLEELIRRFNEACDVYSKEISAYRRMMGMQCKLDNPIGIGSSQQLGILLFDILKLKPKYKVKDAKGTGEEVLKALDHEIPKIVLEYRKYQKLLSTYVDALPEVVLNDGRIHAKFNSLGANTGRFSSDSPKLNWALCG